MSVGPDVLVCCPGCNGTGKRRLSWHLARTLDEIKRGSWISTATISDRMGDVAPKLTALCNRLVRLEQYGLIERRVHAKNARVIEWRRKESA